MCVNSRKHATPLRASDSTGASNAPVGACSWAWISVSEKKEGGIGDAFFRRGEREIVSWAKFGASQRAAGVLLMPKRDKRPRS